MDKKKSTEISTDEDELPNDLWYRCWKTCFTWLAASNERVQTFREVLVILENAKRRHRKMENSRGKHFSTKQNADIVNFENRPNGSKGVKEITEEGSNLHREELSTFVQEVLPFLYGIEKAPNKTLPPFQGLCPKAICCILGISVEFLNFHTTYFRERIVDGKCFIRAPDSSSSDLGSVENCVKDVKTEQRGPSDIPSSLNPLRDPEDGFPTYISSETDFMKIAVDDHLYQLLSFALQDCCQAAFDIILATVLEKIKCGQSLYHPFIGKVIMFRYIYNCCHASRKEYKDLEKRIRSRRTTFETTRKCNALESSKKTSWCVLSE